MKNLIIIISALISISSHAQVGIGQANPSNSYVSIELGTPTPLENKGLILPWVTSTSAVSNAVVGTLIFDSATQKIKLASNSSISTPTTTQNKWIDLSNGASSPATFFKNPITQKGEASTAKVIIGAEETPVEGILVLETPNPDTTPQAMVLPRVNSVTDIINPAAGMLVYEKTHKLLAVFNGSQWSFWAP